MIADVDYDEMEVCWSSFGDFDGDCDVDQSDYALFEQCASGPGVPYAAGCGMRDGDGDGDVDQADFGQIPGHVDGGEMRRGFTLIEVLVTTAIDRVAGGRSCCRR